MCRPVFDETIELKDNAMLKHKPELFNEWDFEKNDELGFNIYKMTFGSNKKIWWNCPDCKTSYDSIIVNRILKNANCPYCSGKRLNNTNSLSTLRPDLAKEWHSTKNGKITPNDVTCGGAAKVWWSCPKCKSDYHMTLNKRTSSGTNCPYCTGRKINHTNSLATLNPALSSQWHPVKNGDLTPHDVTLGRAIKVWWLGECGHEWDARLNIRTGQGSDCPYCIKTNARLLVGFNDMWTTNPELARLLENPEDGYEYMQFSNKKLNWKCHGCKTIIKGKKVHKVNLEGLFCPKCSDGISFGEKFIYNLLREYGISFNYDAAQSWSHRKRYDFYLPEYNWIIEVHGSQHYGSGFDRVGGRSLKEEKMNDQEKILLARKNNIDKYIVLDTRYSTIEHIKKSILDSDIIEILPEIDFLKISILSSGTMIEEVCQTWNSGTRSIEKISRIMNLSNTTIRKYLKRGEEIGWCDYKPKRRKKIVQLDLNLNLICIWDSISEASKSIGGRKDPHISAVCLGKRKTSGGFKWMYKEDYDKLKTS